MIAFIHLNNDFSGSPKVLRDVIRVAVDNNIEYVLYVSSSSKSGFLDEFETQTKKYFFKRIGRYRILTFLSLLISQIHLFFKLCFDKNLKPISVIYVNTLLPFGANLYSFITRKKLICHVHELSLSPPIFNSALHKINKMTSDQNIFVSKEHQRLANFQNNNYVIVPNCICRNLQKNIDEIVFDDLKRKDPFNVLMLSSTSRYKGIPEFLSVAELFLALNNKVSFQLVVNCKSSDIDGHFKNLKIPSNVKIYPVSTSLTNFYSNASIILNMSRPDMWIETFGLTLLEGMAHGLPAIAPNIGGPLDFIEDNVDGFLVDTRDINAVSERINELYQNYDRYSQMSISARNKAKGFNYKTFENNIFKILSNL